MRKGIEVTENLCGITIKKKSKAWYNNNNNNNTQILEHKHKDNLLVNPKIWITKCKRKFEEIENRNSRKQSKMKLGIPLIFQNHEFICHIEEFQSFCLKIPYQSSLNPSYFLKLHNKFVTATSLREKLASLDQVSTGISQSRS